MNGTQIPQIIVVTTIALAAAAAYASPVTSDGYRFVGGEIGYVAEARLGGTLTREQVRRELDQYLRHPITADGYLYIGGEIGFVRDESVSTALGSGTGRALTRAQVQQDFLNFRRNPLSADGAWRYVGGEQGWIPAAAAR